MPDYATRFANMVKEIEAHPLLEVVEFKMNRPLSARALKQVEARLKSTLAAPVRAFYEEMNGFQLRWKLKESALEDVESIESKYDDYSIELIEDEDTPFARINLLPLEESIFTRKWNELAYADEAGEVEFRKQTYLAKEFAQRVRPFDVFSAFAAMAFFLEEGNGNPIVFLVSDYYIEWDNSKLTDFPSYIEFLLANRGISESRSTVYSQYRGDLKPLLLTEADYWTNRRIPKLFRKKRQGSVG